MLTSTIENLLNRGLPRSPRARELCAELSSRRVVVEIQGIARVLVESDGTSLRLVRNPQVVGEAEVSGGVLGLLRLARSSPDSLIQRGDVQIRGDTELAQKFRELAMLLRPDLEEELALAIGDVPAHQLGRFTRTMLGWSRHAAGTAVRNLAEYFAHERGDVISRAQGNQFLKDVDTLREDVDRIEVRVELLAREIEAQTRGKRDA